MDVPEHVLMNFEEVKNELCRSLHATWQQWMRYGGMVGHRYIPVYVTNHDKDGEFVEIRCADCPSPETRHHPDMVPYERITQARRQMYEDMARTVFVRAHAIGEESRSISDVMNAVVERPRD